VDMAQPGLGIGRDISRGEATERELDQLITRRSREKVPEEQSEAWQESAQKHEQQRLLQARYEWHLYHTAQAERHRRTMEILIEAHERAAARLLEGSKTAKGE
jgi:hypothetical protein